MLEAYNFVDGSPQLTPDELPPGCYQRRVREVTLGNAILGYRTDVTRLRRGKWNHALGRTREIERLIRARHGDAVPETDDASIYAEAIAAIYYVEFSEDDYVKLTSGWCRRWYPWADQHYVEAIVYERTKVRFRSISQDALGHMLKLTDEERTRLNIRTIGACDVTAVQRRKRQKQKKRDADRLAKQKARRAAGVRPRAEYLATSLTRSKPWEFFGCSRRTWELRGKPPPATE